MKAMPLKTIPRAIHSLKSWLFTPATKADHFGRAAEAGADALIIDLEDAVASSDKQKARSAALEYLEQAPQRILPCALRINPPSTRTGIDDLQSLLQSSALPDYLILPKCDSVGIMKMVRSLLNEARKETGIIALIESARGVGCLPEIVHGDARPDAVVFGAADMAADLGSSGAWETLLFVRSKIVQVAASAGIVAIDSPFFDIANFDGLQLEAQRVKDLGFSGKCAIHPKQVAVINEVFAPTADEVAKAQQIVAASQQGVGSVGHEMVDEAIARKARLVLDRAESAVTK